MVVGVTMILFDDAHAFVAGYVYFAGQPEDGVEVADSA
jgi:hypothetical protein